MGTTRKKRFLAITALSLTGSALVGYGIVTGALAANLAVSSPTMKIKINKIESGRLQLNGDILTGKHDSDAQPVINVILTNPTLKGLCLAAPTGNLPIIGNVNLVLHTAVLTADTLLLKMSHLNSDIDLKGVSIGMGIPEASGVDSDVFTVNATSGLLGNVELEPQYLSSNNATIKNMSLSVAQGDNPCK